MRCYRCACDNSETAHICPGCGLSLGSASSAIAAPPPFPIGPGEVISSVATVEQALGFATMGERFLAFLCDTSIEAVLVAAFLGYYAESSLDSDALLGIAPLVIPWLYMTLSEVLFHRTIGKRLLRIQLRSDSPGQVYPSFFRILLRETLGKFVSGLILGIGFLAGGWHEKHKTWADRMANTVVVRTGIVGRRLKAVLTVVLICANLGLTTALTEASARHRNQVVQELDAIEKRICHLNWQIFQAFFISEPRSVKDYQQTVAALPPALDEYDRLLPQEKDLFLKSLKLTGASHLREYTQAAYSSVFAWRHEIALLVRKHVEKALAFDPQRQTWDELLRDRQQMMDEISRRNQQINDQGWFSIPLKVTFDHKPKSP